MSRKGAQGMADDPIDGARLEALSVALDRGRTERLVALYLAELASDRAALRATLGRCEIATAAAAAHRLANASRAIGAAAVAAAAGALAAGLHPRSGQGAVALRVALRDFDTAVVQRAAALTRSRGCASVAAA